MNIENKNIILTTLNSRFSHSSLSLRYLFANLKELKDEAKILEFVINSQNQTIVEEILEYKPKIVLISTIQNLLQLLRKNLFFNKNCSNLRHSLGKVLRIF